MLLNDKPRAIHSPANESEQTTKKDPIEKNSYSDNEHTELIQNLFDFENSEEKQGNNMEQVYTKSSNFKEIIDNSEPHAHDYKQGEHEATYSSAPRNMLHTSKTVSKIVVFYSDNTFEEFFSR